MRILYICDADDGGIAEYAYRQSRALCVEGVEVVVLCRSTFDTQRLNGPKILPHLPEAPRRQTFFLIRIFQQIFDARAVMKMVVKTALQGHFDALLFASYREYYAPFWASLMRGAEMKGLMIGAIAHDPVRDFVHGPVWWHRWSIRQAYSFVSHVFVHDQTPVDFGGLKSRQITSHIIPHGAYELSAASEDRMALRQRYGFVESDTVFLSFGHIRDGKNLDRFIRAMKELPETVKLLVAGSANGLSQKKPEEYIGLAEQHGVSHRCFWDVRYIPDIETGDLFESADHILLTYNANFHSASGVLNTAVFCRRSVLASSGFGPLKSAVEEYQLGVFVPPDDDEKILEGARKLEANEFQPDWQRYERDNSWEKNAKLVIQAFE